MRDLREMRLRGPVLSVRRMLICLGLGAVVGAGVAYFESPELSFLVGWTVAAALAVAWVWWIGWPRDAAGTEQVAEEEARTRSTDGGVLIASVISLCAVVFALVRTSTSQDAIATAVAVLSVFTVLASWALVNTVFALKYARPYYVDEREGGVDFRQNAPPAYRDFAYMAFTIGMSYSVAGSEPTTTRARKMVLGHGLLSYLFGTGVLAVGVNLLANLGQL